MQSHQQTRQDQVRGTDWVLSKTLEFWSPYRVALHHLVVDMEDDEATKTLPNSTLLHLHEWDVEYGTLSCYTLCHLYSEYKVTLHPEWHTTHHHPCDTTQVQSYN